MSNEQYLIVTYFGFGLLSIVLGTAVSLWLRKPFVGTAEGVANLHLVRQLRRMFSPGIILSALAGFLSVSYGCPPNYEKIVADRDFMIMKNHEQVAECLFYLTIAVMAWVFIITLAIALVRRQKARH
jgi:cobalamin biosynthesis protein CobD/CbiB